MKFQEEEYEGLLDNFQKNKLVVKNVVINIIISFAEN